jgi:hypothetical protein
MVGVKKTALCFRWDSERRSASAAIRTERTPTSPQHLLLPLLSRIPRPIQPLVPFLGYNLTFLFIFYCFFTIVNENGVVRIEVGADVTPQFKIDSSTSDVSYLVLSLH